MMHHYMQLYFTLIMYFCATGIKLQGILPLNYISSPFLLWDRVSLGYPGWLWTHVPLASASRVTGITPAWSVWHSFKPDYNSHSPSPDFPLNLTRVVAELQLRLHIGVATVVSKVFVLIFSFGKTPTKERISNLGGKYYTHKNTSLSVL